LKKLNFAKNPKMNALVEDGVWQYFFKIPKIGSKWIEKHTLLDVFGYRNI
jgi:hypothetical protein